MALATHLGPWLLGTVKNTTGTTAGTIRNTGYTQSVQNAAVAYNNSATQVMVLPAGAIILEVYLFQSGATFTSGSTGTFTILVNGTSIGAASISGAGTAGIIGINPSTLAQTTLMANVGTTDAIITVTGATLTAGSGQLVIYYGVRNADGTYQPTAYTA